MPGGSNLRKALVYRRARKWDSHDGGLSLPAPPRSSVRMTRVFRAVVFAPVVPFGRRDGEMKPPENVGSDRGLLPSVPSSQAARRPHLLSRPGATS